MMSIVALTSLVISSHKRLIRIKGGQVYLPVNILLMIKADQVVTVWEYSPRDHSVEERPRHHDSEH